MNTADALAAAWHALRKIKSVAELADPDDAEFAIDDIAELADAALNELRDGGYAPAGSGS